MREAGKPADERQILEQILRRDQRDAHRSDGPLICPPDATRVDTSGMTLDGVVDHLEKIVRRAAPTGDGEMTANAIRRFRGRQPGAPLYRIVWWYFCHALCCIWIWPCYRYRAWGAENIPSEGAGAFRQQSPVAFLDPILVGLSGYRRQFYAMARSSLFRFRFFAWLIRSLNAIPIDRGTSDVAAMKKCIEVLNDNQGLLIFPEGTRTPDGVTQRFNTGTFLLIKRAKPRVVPVAVEGSHAAWPRDRKRPRLDGPHRRDVR